ncbi:MAG: hypothetical protein ACM3MK_13985 [Chitinophagales bacterium]
MAQDVQELRGRIIKFAAEHGADLVGFAPVGRWDEYDEVPADFRPGNLFPLARTVVVIGMGMPLPIVETTPSAMHMELYNTVNRELDGLAYCLTGFLNRSGWPSMFFPRDGYGSIKILKEKPRAAFSHVEAARYAGLGTVGLSGVLLTREFGSRVRLVSVFTSAELPGSPVLSEDICIKCQACAKCCPSKAIIPRKDRTRADFEAMKCMDWAHELTRRRSYPCGVCTKVCPIGADRELYQATKSMKKYLHEAEAMRKDPDDPEYKVWNHFRHWGSW